MKYQTVVFICCDLLRSFSVHSLVINEYYVLVSFQFFILTQSLHRTYKVERIVSRSYMFFFETTQRVYVKFDSTGRRVCLKYKKK